MDCWGALSKKHLTAKTDDTVDNLYGFTLNNNLWYEYYSYFLWKVVESQL